MSVQKPTSQSDTTTQADGQAIRALAVRMALELDVHVDRAEKAIRNLRALGLIERSAENAH